MSSLRAISARIIDDVTRGRSLTDSFDARMSVIKDARDKALVQAICYGVCRFYTRLDVMLSHLLQKPLNEKEGEVHALLLVGLYQLWAMRVPPHAAVAETVQAVITLKKPWARGLVNAVLRNYLRKQEQIENEIASDGEAFYAHPAWWINKIRDAWPDDWQTILAANNAHPPMSLRVNQQKLSRENYLAKLETASIIAHSLPETQSGIWLETPMLAEALPGFEAGEVSVQDGAAQLAAEFLPVESGQRILDACAAPGGKLTHLLEKQKDLIVVAVDREQARMQALHDNLARLHQNATCLCADAADVTSWWDQQLFDHILLDAPCSGSGVVRRHPDIKLLRRRQDIPALAKEQLQLLRSLWPLLKSGGCLLYATCSIFPEENTGVIEQFLADHAGDCKYQWSRQILPGIHHMDGFYYALLRKV